MTLGVAINDGIFCPKCLRQSKTVKI